MNNKSNVILIGGFGFVGRNILSAITQGTAQGTGRQARPCVIDDLSNAAPGHAALDLPAFEGGYGDSRALGFLDDETHSGPRVFVFLAGETRVAESADRPLDFIEANIAGPSDFVMRGVRAGDHFVLISTAGALFDGTREVRTSTPYCPKNFYGATKAAEEMILKHLVELRGATFSVLRMTNVYGLYSQRKKSAVHAFVRAALVDATVTVNGDGAQSRDFVFSGDVGRAIATHCEQVLAGEDVDGVSMIGSGTSTSLMDVIGSVERAAGQPLAYEKVPATDLIASEPRDVIASRVDIKRIMGDQITPFDQGVALTHAHYRATL